MNILDAKKRMYDDMEEYAGNKAADGSEALKAFRGGVPIAQESVTVVAKPKPGTKLSPEELKKKVSEMGLVGLNKGGFEDLLGTPDSQDIEDALSPDETTTEEKLRMARMRGGR